MGLEPTTVWSYGSVNHPETFNYPAFTIEAAWGRPARVKWINDLVKPNGEFRPHLLPVDQTLHWANPPGGAQGRDEHGSDQAPYRGPVPIVTHLHGGHSTEESDGFPEAWYLPHARNIPAGYARTGSLLSHVPGPGPGQASSGLDARQRGLPIRERPARDDDVVPRPHARHDARQRLRRAGRLLPAARRTRRRCGRRTLPGPAPALGDPPGIEYFEIPIAIQDRSFNEDGSLFYPDNRAYFEGLDPSQLQIPFAPDPACDGPSDVAPIWNPEFFGNAIVVNGKTWPYSRSSRAAIASAF